MSLKLVKISTFQATATVSLPTERVDECIEGTFTCRFNYLKHDEVNAYLDGLVELNTSEGRVQPATLQESLDHQHAFLKRVLIGVDGLLDAESHPLSPEPALAGSTQRAAAVAGRADRVLKVA